MIIKNRKKSSTRKKLLIIAGVVVILISTFLILEATGATHIIRSLNDQTTDTNITPEQAKENEINSNNKETFVTDKSNSNTSNPDVQALTSDNISISTQRETDGSVTILTQLKNYSDGTCDLTITNGSNKYTQTAQIIYQESFSSCAGFSVPLNSLPTGTWQISMTVTSKDIANTKTASMEVQ